MLSSDTLSTRRPCHSLRTTSSRSNNTSAVASPLDFRRVGPRFRNSAGVQRPVSAKRRIAPRPRDELRPGSEEAFQLPQCPQLPGRRTSNLDQTVDADGESGWVLQRRGSEEYNAARKEQSPSETVARDREENPSAFGLTTRQRGKQQRTTQHLRRATFFQCLCSLAVSTISVDPFGECAAKVGTRAAIFVRISRIHRRVMLSRGARASTTRV